MEKKCLYCGQEFIGKRKDSKYCCENCYRKAKRREKNDYNKVCCRCGKNFEPMEQGHTRAYCYDCVPFGYTSTDIRRLIKEWLVEEKGGACECCGFNLHHAALDFHHLNPQEKEFNIGAPGKIDYKINKQEADKCILVCANCHRLIHAGVLDIEKRGH